MLLVDRQDLVRHARRWPADEEVLGGLRRLPDVTLTTRSEVTNRWGPMLRPRRSHVRRCRSGLAW
ncbi:DUF2795 domain-containing protein [Micromonospora sediminicola]|uniref:DUF2795 domain-containing protein n=1 Tax=Micromonospora sediminicola TaxID=946078 RepID=UPI001C40076E